MADRLQALQIFVRVAQRGSFSSAAHELGLSQPSASRIVAALERDVGASLLTRNTHAVTLTQSGADYLTRAEAILAAMQAADHAARGGRPLRGRVRIAAPASFVGREIMPRLARFMEQHPALRLDFIADEHRQDLVSGGVDVAFRFGAPRDGPAVARRLAAEPRVCVAAPAYIGRVGAPARPDDLSHHIAVLNPAADRSDAWRFVRNGQSVQARPRAALHFSQAEPAIQAAVAGLGVTSTGLWGCRAELQSGALQQLLPDWSLGSVDLYAIFPAGRNVSPAARAFADHIGDTLDRR
jgi:DNA-binding transcriptional LysR family regulator